ncbi:MAG: sigma-70 family RNA polymerase sigma factor [Planctomycetaceae bacterium]|nr:sigma-70 family RNA polymerase sigma factor [Planctomycetaceae bacterium]
MGTDTEILGGSKHFVKTSWFLVRSAGKGGDWDPLVRLYWKPLYFYLRRKGLDNETAKDVVQDFIASLIERRAIEKADPARGRFRTFLLAALDHFLTDRKRRESRQKRGGGAPVLSLDFAVGERDYSIEVEGGETPEKLACRAWAHGLLDECLLALDGDPSQIAALRMRLKGADYRQICDHTGLSESAAHLAVHRLSKEFGEILGGRLRDLCGETDDFEAELADFMELIS